MPKLADDLIQLNEIQLKNKFPDLYNQVLMYIEESYESNVDIKTFREKLYVYHNDLTIRPTCKWCSGDINFWKFDKGYKQFCSNKCGGQYLKSQPQEIKNEINDKRKKTCIEKYNVDNIAKDKSTQQKIQNTNLKKYGTLYPLLNDNIKNKRDITFDSNWGGHPLSNIEKIKERTLNRKITFDNNRIDFIKNILKENAKIIRLNNEDLSVDIFCEKCTEEINIKYYTIYQRRHFDIICTKCVPLNSYYPNKNEKTLNKYKKLNINDITFISYSTEKFTCIHNSKNHEFEITRRLLYDRLKEDASIICTICNKVEDNDSSHQIDIKHFLDSLNVNYILNDNNILDGKHIDLYLPEYNLGIELNGLYWHSELYKTKDYHLNKTLKCKEKGIHLLHIFEDDWIYKKEIVKSIILNKLNLIHNRIYARKCVIKEVKAIDAINFLDDNHIQGSCRSSIKLGLYYNNILVSLMTFGYRKTNTKKEFELIRFCNKINISVVGASSKLFKYFIKNYKINEGYLISYSDLSLFDGGMYETLGFKYIHLSEPNYFWVVDKKRYHRWVYNKQKLINDGYDPNKTEVEIMQERGYYRIWGCGQVRWEYHIKDI